MERRKALFLAGTITLALGSATVALAATGTVNLLGFGGPHGASAVSTSPTIAKAKAHVVTRKRNVYDKFVVSVPADPPAAGGGSSSQPAAPSAPGPYVIPVTAQPTAQPPAPPATPPATAPSSRAPWQPSKPSAPQTTTTVTASPTTVTTLPPQTTTTVCHRECSDDPPGDR